MYGNNIGGPFMMPNNMPYGFMMRSAPMMRNMGMMNGASMMRAPRGGGLSSLLGLGRASGGTSTLTGARSLNLGNLLNGASRALGVVNQAIPIVKEVGPMMNNMKSMLKIASIFKDETDTTVKTTNDSEKKTNSDRENKTEEIKESSTDTTSTTSNTKTNNNEPNFFL